MVSLGEQLLSEKQELMAAYKADGLPTPEASTLQATTLR
jgi:hypothetical protein